MDKETTEMIERLVNIVGAFMIQMALCQGNIGQFGAQPFIRALELLKEDLKKNE